MIGVLEERITEYELEIQSKQKELNEFKLINEDLLNKITDYNVKIEA